MKDVTETVSNGDGLFAVFAEWQVYVLVGYGLGAITLQQLALRAGDCRQGCRRSRSRRR